MLSANKPIMIMGFDAILNKYFSTIYVLFTDIKHYINAKGGLLNFGANSRGSLLSHTISYYSNQVTKSCPSALSIFDIVNSEPTRGLLFLVDVDLEYDYLIDRIMLSKFKNTKVVLFSPFYNNKILQYVDILLPVTTLYETDGSFVNVLGVSQKLKKVIQPLFKSRSLWSLFLVLGEILSSLDFSYKNIDSIYNRINKYSIESCFFNRTKNIRYVLQTKYRTFNIVPIISMYKTNSLLRQSDCLSSTEDFQWYSSVRVSIDISSRYFSKNKLPIVVTYNKYCSGVLIVADSSVAFNTVMIPFEKFKDSKCIIQAMMIFNQYT
jgi:NADH-quinone oxidoreductase subunit G